MAKKFSELRAKMSPESRVRSQEKTHGLLEEMALNELREARKLTQENLADILRVNQAAVSKLENRVDMYVSTLRRFIEAMGGQLIISASFPEGSVRINHFEQAEKEESHIRGAVAVGL
jgi:transcriptional regulator with XRE-family HTH domain